MQNSTSAAISRHDRGIRVLLEGRDDVQQQIKDAYRRLEATPSQENIQSLTDMLTGLSEVQNCLTKLGHTDGALNGSLRTDSGSQSAHNAYTESTGRRDDVHPRPSVPHRVLARPSGLHFVPAEADTPHIDARQSQQPTKRNMISNDGHSLASSRKGPKLFDQLDKQKYPTIVYLTGGWAEMWCPNCGVNAHEMGFNNEGEFNKGISGVFLHFSQKHEVDPMQYGFEKWTYKATAQVCETHGACRYLSEEDVDLIRNGDAPKIKIVKRLHPNQDTQRQRDRRASKSSDSGEVHADRRRSTVLSSNSGQGHRQMLSTVQTRDGFLTSSARELPHGPLSPTTALHRQTDATTEYPGAGMPKTAVSGPGWKWTGDDIEFLDVGAGSQNVPRSSTSAFH